MKRAFPLLFVTLSLVCLTGVVTLAGTEGERTAVSADVVKGDSERHPKAGSEERRLHPLRYDRNGDGKLDETEKAEMKSELLKEREKKRADLLRRYDQNKNGKLDPEEREAFHKGRLARHRALLEKHDKNKDGRLDASERKEMRSDPSQAGGERLDDLLSKYDANGNGSLDPEEREALHKDRLARQKEVLHRYDKNGDGILDETERAEMQGDPEN